MNSSDCLFCKIVEGQIPANIVGRSNEALAFTDINPKAPVHILIIPKQHLASVSDVGPEHANVLSEMISLANEQAKLLDVAESGFRLVVNNGPDAGQSVDHLHLHLMAGRRMTWPPG